MDLPDKLQQIYDTENRRPSVPDHLVPHYIEFVAEGESTLATFRSDGPMPLPQVEQRIVVHQVPVVVMEVDTAYEVREETETASFSVYTTIKIKPVAEVAPWIA